MWRKFQQSGQIKPALPSLKPKSYTQQGPLFSSMKVERGKEGAEEKLEASREQVMRFMERIHCCNIKMQSEAANADVEGTANYLEDLARIIKESGSTK